jgi:hypothetical protein
MAMKFNDILAASFSNRPVNWRIPIPSPIARDGPLPRLSEGQIPIGKGCHRHTQRDKEDLKNAGANPPPNKLAGDNDCLTDRAGGVFVWSERTMTKLADCSVERIAQNQTAQAYLLLV